MGRCSQVFAVKTTLIVAGACAMCLPTACRRNTPTEGEVRRSNAAPEPGPAAKTPNGTSNDAGTRSQTQIVLPDHNPDHWLAVLHASKEKAGGWATGRFDSKRNKITIDTHDVEAFTINTELIPIAWERLVIIAIDGRTGELVKRDQPVLRFIKNKQRTWVVEDSP